MATPPGSFCPQCGTPVQGSPRFCTNCGATIEIHANSPTLAVSQTPLTPPAGSGAEVPPPPGTLASGSIYPNSNDRSLPPPPPPPPIYNPYTSNPSNGPQSYSQTTLPNSYTPPPVATPPQAGAYQVPEYARKPKGGHGCVTASIVLLLILVLGIGGYVLIHSLAFKNNTSASNTPISGTGNPATSTNQGNTPTTGTSATSTVQLNLQFTYASVNITLLSAQLAQQFSDDNNTTASSGGIVRINLRENNSTSHNPNYVESYALLLLLPGGTTVQARNEQVGSSPDPGVNRQNWIDFPLDSPIALDQLTLRVGTQNQYQFDIPLRANADISKYHDKTSTLGNQFKYGNLNMTLKSATLSYSYDDQQATAGNRYVILTLAAVNTTTTTTSIYPSNTMRLQAGGNSIEPDSTFTIPYDLSGNTSGSGVVAFLVPQDATSFTLVLLAQPNVTPAISQATQAFQV